MIEGVLVYSKRGNDCICRNHAVVGLHAFDGITLHGQAIDTDTILKTNAVRFEP